jgi:AcrR family transcriptional regulator
MAKKRTRDRLLQAACEVFAKKGFADTTVAEICAEADANIASVNYYFGSKEALYDAVWHRAFELAEAFVPLEASLPEEASLESYVFHLARSVLSRTFCEGNGGLFSKLLYREMASPTLALERISEEVFEPQMQRLRGAILRAYPEAEEKEILACVHSIIAQCAFYNFSRPLRDRILAFSGFSADEIEGLARHIARFSVGGLKEALQ